MLRYKFPSLFGDCSRGLLQAIECHNQIAMGEQGRMKAARRLVLIYNQAGKIRL